jgi:outer membrane lipoprotein-sorting protein
MKKLVQNIIFGVAVLLFLSVGLLASKEEEVLKKIDRRLEDIETLQVDFEQEVSSGVFATVDKTSGGIFLTDDDRFRIETDDQTIVSDSVLIWVYSVENKQVKIDSVHEVDDLVRPSDYIFSFKEGYEADLLTDTTCDFGTCYKIVLTALEKDNFIKEMYLFIDPETYLTRRAEYKDINGNLVTIRFKDYKIDRKIPAEIFKFKTPKGVEEIRLP